MSGECQVIIALHCTSGHLEAFSRNIVPHGRAGYRIHAIDALGHGYTDKPNEPYEVYKYGEHVLRYMDAQGIEQAHLMGESLGGWTSGWLAINHPDLVRSVQLIEASDTKAEPDVMLRIKKSPPTEGTSDHIAPNPNRLNLLIV